MRILLVDNYDSFTYNLLHMLKEECNPKDNIALVKNDEIDIEAVSFYDKIILSPGPGIPSEAGLLLPLIERWAAYKAILGVCLGFHAIGQVFGARLVNPGKVYHGIRSRIEVTHPVSIFKDMPVQFEAGRYHSWLIEKEDFPECLHITATDEEGNIMALSHETYDIHGVQFHPESILTPEGKKIIRNFLSS